MAGFVLHPPRRRAKKAPAFREKDPDGALREALRRARGIICDLLLLQALQPDSTQNLSDNPRWGCAACRGTWRDGGRERHSAGCPIKRAKQFVRFGVGRRA